jgi:outer membrane protein assembly factor BamB
VEALIIAATLLWSFKADAPADVAPLVAGDVVYYASADKKLYALDSRDGARFWSRRFKAPLTTTPILAGGFLYQYVPHPEGRIYALRPEDGETVWRAQAGPGIIIPAAGGGVVVAGLKHELVFFDAATGEELGRTPFDGVVTGAAATGDGDFVAWTAAGRMGRCGPGRAEPSWETDAARAAIYPAVAGNRIYVAEASGAVACYDAVTGEELWRRETGDKLGAAPELAGQGLIVAGRRTLFMFDVEGELLAEVEFDGNVVGAAASTGGAIVVREDGRVLIVYAGGSEGQGEITELFRLEEYAACAPVISGRLLLVADGKEQLKCYELE